MITAKQGFFLMEFLIVITLIMVIIGLALPSLSFLNNTVLKSEVEKLAMVCYYLRQYALATHKEQKLTFNQARQSYTVDSSTYSLSNNIRFGFLPECYGPPSQPLHKINQAITFVHDKIQFFPDGSMSSGTIYLIDATKQYAYAITIPSAQLPYIRKYEYQNRWVLMP